MAKHMRALGFWTACFIAPIAIYAAVSAVCAVYPFGPTSLLAGDLELQYIDFFAWFRSVLLGKGSLFYAHTLGTGSNAWGLYSYYLASPFNVLIIFFDLEQLPLFVFVTNALRLGCIQLATTWFLRRRFRLSPVAAFALAIGFTWSTWTATNLRNPPWLDSLILLPLACWSIYRLVRTSSWWRLAAVLTAAIATSWYTAYMTGCFIFVYTLFEWVLMRWGQPSAATGERTGDAAHAAEHAAGTARHTGAAPRAASRRQGARAAGPSRAAATSTRASRSTRAAWPHDTHPLRACYLRFFSALGVALALSFWTFLPTVFSMLGSASGTSSRMIERIDDALAAIRALAERLGLAPILVGAIALVALVAALVIAVRRGLAGPHRARTVRTIELAAAGIFIASCIAVTISDTLAGMFALLTRSTIPELLRSFLPGGYVPEVTPQLFADSVVLVLAVSFFFQRSIPWRIRRAGLLILLFYLAAMYLLPLELVWCGLRHPKGFYSRTAVYVLFFMMVLAALAWPAMRGRLGCIVHEHASAGGTSTAHGAPAALDGTAPAHHALGMRLAGAALVIFCMVEVTVASSLAWNGIYPADHTHDAHVSYIRAITAQASELTALDDGTWRFEHSSRRAGEHTLGDSFVTGLAGVSSYSSVNSGDALALLDALGLGKPNDLIAAYAYPNLLLDSLLGIRYEAADTGLAGFEQVLDASGPETLPVYRNPFALPLGYGASASVIDSALPAGETPFEAQEALASAIAGRSVDAYQPLEATLVSESTDARTWQVTVPEGMIGYAYLLVEDESSVFQIAVDGAAPQAENTATRLALHPISTDTAGGTHTVTLSGPVAATGATLVFQALDVETVDALASELAAQPLTITTWEDGHIEGSIEVAGDRVLLLTIPYDRGWTVTVNGERVEAAPAFGGGFMAIPLTGEEADAASAATTTATVELSYLSPGFVPGCIVSGIAAGACLISALVRRRRR